MKNILFLLSSALALACNPTWMRPAPTLPAVKVMGYVPVYSQDASALKIWSDTAWPVRNAGKIYAKGNLIFQSDVGYGVHVIDKSDPTHAKRIAFLHLPGNMEISIKGNLLYGNCYSDLVVVDISNWHAVKEIQRIKNAFQQGNQVQIYSNNGYYFVPPPEGKVFYECVDPGKGIVTGWRKDSVYNNGCYMY